MQLLKSSYQLYPIESQRDPFIDFLKGVAILGVVWLHCMPFQGKMLAPLWCRMSVSFFILIQVFHAYRYGPSASIFPNLQKISKRIILPMFIVTGILAIIHWQFCIVRYAGGIVQTLMNGGFGPGSYYPWIYVQFAFLLPFFRVIFLRLPLREAGGGVFIAFYYFRNSVVLYRDARMVMENTMF